MDAAADSREGAGLITGRLSMDLQKAIRELYEERERIDRMIASLELYLARHETGAIKLKRGRKSMGPAEREVVSARMRGYWAAQRTEIAK